MGRPRDEEKWTRRIRANRRHQAYRENPHCPHCKVLQPSVSDFTTLDNTQDGNERWLGCRVCAIAEIRRRRVETWLAARRPKPSYYATSPTQNKAQIEEIERAEHSQLLGYNTNYFRKRNVDIVRYYHHVCPHCKTFSPEVDEWLIFDNYAGCTYCAESRFGILVTEIAEGHIDESSISDLSIVVPMPFVTKANIIYSAICKANPVNAHYAY